MTTEERIKGRRIGVLGMARSGMAAAQLALEMGGLPCVSDSGDAEALAVRCNELEKMGIPFEVGAHTDRLLDCDYILISPGVLPSIELVQVAMQRGVPVFSELEFAAWVCPARIVAITGSNGKTTTTTLVGEILAAGGFDVHVCGNVGRPFAGTVRNMTPDSIAVVEVSSFQLETIEDFRPSVAAILNLTPDHIDRHGTFEEYKKAKYRITENQTAEDILILNRDDRETAADSPETSARKACFTAESRSGCDTRVEDDQLWTSIGGESTSVVRCREIAIKGPHNLQNAAAAVTVGAQFEIKPETMGRVLRSFPGVEHRLESIGAVAGVSFVNDSKATNVDSVCYALKSVDTSTCLICGGRDKGGKFEPIIEAGRDRIKSIIAIGEAREKIFDTLGRAFPTQFAVTLEEAVEKSFEMAHPGETVLLSPGCASFDMFEDFEHRGRVFKAAVRALRNGKNSDRTVTG